MLGDLKVMWTMWKSTIILEPLGRQTQNLRRPTPNLAQELQCFDHGVWLTDKISFLDFVHRLNLCKKHNFRKPPLLPSSGNKTSNLKAPLDVVILSHWYRRNTQRIEICAWEQLTSTFTCSNRKRAIEKLKLTSGLKKIKPGAMHKLQPPKIATLSD